MQAHQQWAGDLAGPALGAAPLQDPGGQPGPGAAVLAPPLLPAHHPGRHISGQSLQKISLGFICLEDFIVSEIFLNFTVSQSVIQSSEILNLRLLHPRQPGSQFLS